MDEFHLEYLGDKIITLLEAKTCKLSRLSELANLDLSTDFIGVDFRNEDLSEDDLTGINLRKADLSGANFCGSNMSRANLSGTNLSESNLSRVNLTNANLSGANLRGANLTNANLSGTNLRGVDFTDAELNGTQFDEDSDEFASYKSTSVGRDKSIVGNSPMQKSNFEKGTSRKDVSSTLQMKPIEGKELLEKIASMEGANKIEKAKACGYVTFTKGGQERISLMAFYKALLEAEGMTFEAAQVKRQRGREATYKVSVNKNGTLLIGSAYTKELGLFPGDELEIKLGKRNIKLELIDSD